MSCNVRGVSSSDPTQGMELFEPVLLVGHLPLAWHHVKRVQFWKEYVFFLSTSFLFISHMIAWISPTLPLSHTFALMSCTYTPDKAGEVRWGAAASLGAQAPLLWSSTADMIIDTTPTPTSRPPETVTLISLYLQTSKKKKKKDQKAKRRKILFVSQSATESLHLNPNEEFHYQGMKQLSSATCLRSIRPCTFQRRLRVSQSSPFVSGS